LGPLVHALCETFLMAVVGAALGIIGAFVLAVLAARHLSPHPLSYYGARSVIALCQPFRTPVGLLRKTTQPTLSRVHPLPRVGRRGICCSH